MQGPCRNMLRTVPHMSRRLFRIPPEIRRLNLLELRCLRTAIPDKSGRLSGCPESCSVRVLRTLLRSVRTGVAVLHGVPAGRACAWACLFCLLYHCAGLRIVCRMRAAVFNKAPPCRYARCTRLVDCGALPRGYRPLGPPEYACASRATGMLPGGTSVCAVS
jgi:hypothetical protein